MIITAKNIKAALTQELKPYETFIRFYHKHGRILFHSGFELVEEVRMWRKQCKQGHVKLNPDNNLTKTIRGIPYYIMVVESVESNWRFDPIGLGFDEEFIINGIIYVFKKERDRDMSFQYICKID